MMNEEKKNFSYTLDRYEILITGVCEWSKKKMDSAYTSAN